MAVKRGGLGKGLDSMIPMSDSGAIRKKKTAPKTPNGYVNVIVKIKQ